MLRCESLEVGIPGRVLVRELDLVVPAGRFVAGMRERGVLCGAFGGFAVRMVTHYEIDDGAIEKGLVAARATLAS